MLFRFKPRVINPERNCRTDLHFDFFTDAGTLVKGQRADLLVCTDDVIAHPEKICDGALLEVVKDGVAYRGAIDAFPQHTYRSRAREAMWPPGTRLH